jgi:hypothetical protein
LKRITSSKPVKLLMLLLTSTLIAAASAAIYYSMVMQPSVAVTAATIRFAQGNDWPTGSTLGSNGTWVSLTLKAYPNATMIYEQPLNITNSDSTGHTFRLRHITITPASGNAQVGNFTFINFVVQNTTGTAQASFNYTTSTNTWTTPSTTLYVTLPASTTWIVYIETKATAGANDGVTANIQIAVDVQ